MSRPTAHERILADLAETRGWFCGSTWYATYLPTFSQRVSELNRKSPGLILGRPCHRDGHRHRGGIFEYALAKYATPEQRRLIA